MKYSIIVPIYKVEPYLRECIESVLSQDYSNWELILVDDGSPDNSPAICDEYASSDDRIRVVHKPNGGLVSARKAGLEIATGDYVVCLDGDDFLHQECLSRVDKAIECTHPDVLCFGYFSYSQDSEICHPLRVPRYGFYDRSAILTEIFDDLIHSKTTKRFPPHVWSKVFRMDIYRKYQMKVSSDISMGEDSACTYPLICSANSMELLEDCLYYYRQVQTSMTKVKKPLSWNNFDKVFELYEKEIEIDKLGLRDQIMRARTHNLFNISMSQFYSRLPYCDVVKLIKRQFESHPEYDQCINGSSFKILSLVLAKFALKYRLFPMLKLYSIFK